MTSTDELEWDDLRYFLAVTDTGSFTQAAAKLGVSYSTVTRRVSSLEERLGVRLLNRNRGGYELTSEAKEMAGVARRVEGEIHSLSRHLSGRDKRLSGRLRIATTEMLALTYMPDFAAFRVEYPNIEVDIVATSERADLSSREADIALRMGNHPSENLVGRRLGVLPVALYASEGYLSRYPADLEPSKHIWISWDLSQHQMPTHAWMRRHAPDAEIGFRVSSGIGLLSALKAGLGVAHIFCSLGDSEDSLHRIQPPEPDLETALWILTHDDLKSTARVRAFLDFMVRRIRHRATPIDSSVLGITHE